MNEIVRREEAGVASAGRHAEKEKHEMIIIHQGVAFDTNKVGHVKELHRSDGRAIRVYFDDWRGNGPSTCEYPDPNGDLYAALETYGVSAS